MDPYAVHMMPGTSVATYIALPHANIVAHVQDPFLKFQSIMVCTCWLLWS